MNAYARIFAIAAIALVIGVVFLVSAPRPDQRLNGAQLNQRILTQLGASEVGKAILPGATIQSVSQGGPDFLDWECPTSVRFKSRQTPEQLGAKMKRLFPEDAEFKRTPEGYILTARKTRFEYNRETQEYEYAYITVSL